MTELVEVIEDVDSEPFWAAAREGRLHIQKCSDCGRHIFYPREVCPHCMSVDIAWVTASGQGTLYSYTVIHRAPSGFDHAVPYAVGLVDLAEGVRLMVQLAIHQPRIGQRVTVEFRDRSDGLPIPCCREARP